MNVGLWKKARKVLACVLLITICSNTTPNILLSVHAASKDITDVNNYKITVSGELVSGGNAVSGGSSTSVEAVLSTDYVWSPKGVKPEVEVSVSSGDTLNYGSDYKVTYGENTSVGQGTVTISGSGSYSGEKSVKFNIVPAKINNENAQIRFKDYVGVENGIPYYKYTENGVTPSVELVYNEDIIEGKNYTISCGDASGSGSNKTLEITGKENLSGSLTATYAIRKEITDENVKISGIDNLTYDGTDKSTAIEVTVSSGDLVSGTDYEVTYKYQDEDEKSEAINAGTVTVTVKGLGEYYGSVDEVFTINPADIANLALSIEPNTKEYDGEVVELGSIAVKDGEKELSLESDYELSCEVASIKNPGTYAIKVNGKGNYKGSKDVSYSITKVPLEADMVTILDITTMKVPDVTVKKGNVEFSMGEDYDYTVKFNPDDIDGIGEYELTVSATENGKLTGEVSKIFHVNSNSDVTENVLQISDVVKLESEGKSYYYYRDAGSVKIKAVDDANADNEILSCVSGGDLKDGIVTLKDGEEEIVVNVSSTPKNVENAESKIAQITLGTFIKDATVPKITQIDVTTENTNAIKSDTDDLLSILSDTDVTITAEITETSGGSPLDTPKLCVNGTEIEIEPEESETTRDGESVTVKYSWKISKGDGYLCDSYIIMAADKAGNVTESKEIKVEIDNANPKFSIEYNKPSNEKNDTVYYGGEAGEIEVKFSITEDAAVFDESGLNGCIVQVTKTGETEESNTQSDVPITWSRDKENNNMYIGSFTLPDEGNYNISISYKDQMGNPMVLADDNKGNYGTVDDGKYTSINLVVDKTAPQVKTEFVVKNGVQWEEITPNNQITVASNVRKYFNVENVYWKVTVEDANVCYGDIVKSLEEIEAIDSLGKEIEATIDAKSEINGISTDTIANEEFTWYIPLTTEANYTIPVNFNDLANNKAIINGSAEESYNELVTVDYTSPEITVSYETEVNNKENANFIDSISEWLDRVFGQNTITVTLSVKEDIAGIASIDYVYDENGLQKQEGVIEEPERGSNGEYIYKIELQNNDNSFVADKLVLNITENAQNNLENVIGSTVLVMDNVAPELQVKYDADFVEGKDAEGNTIYYYTQNSDEAYETVTLTYTEAFYDKYVDIDGKPIEPEIVVVNKNNEMVEADIHLSEFSEGKITATINLPYDEEGNELEYIIKTTYVDGSKNQLVMQEESFGNVAENENKVMQFTSGIIVLDNKAPELTRYQVSGLSDRKDQKDVDVYQHSKDGDVVLTFAIEDNAQYWNADNVVFKIYDETHECYVDYEKSSLVWDSKESGNTHTAKLVLKTCTSDPATYRVEIGYTDRAGNKLVDRDLTDGSLEDGKYTSEQFVLDHKAPIFNISYNQANRLVKVDGTWEDDKLGAVPENGYTAYYGAKEGKIVVNFSVDEHYANYIEEDGLFKGLSSDFNLQIMKTYKGATTNVSDELSSKIIWSKVDNNIGKNNVNGYSYKGELVIDEEGEYVISVSYRDTAKNQMAAGNVQGSSEQIKVNDKFTGNMYVSETLVLDKTAPVVTTQYSKTPVNKNDATGRIYFDSSDVIFDVKVEDDNARYHELSDHLMRISAAYVEGYTGGSAINISDSKNAIESFKNYNEILSKDDVLRIPLSVEGNYTIPIAFEDLAGNKAVFGEDSVESYNELATVDWTPAVVKLSSKVVVDGKAVGTDFNTFNYGLDYLFSQGTLQITATVEDNISGVQGIEFTFAGDEARDSEKKEFKPVASCSLVTNIPYTKTDYKGLVKAVAVDWSDNSADSEQGQVVEKPGSSNNANGNITISEPEPSRIVDGVAYYNSDITLGFTFWDGYAGIRSWNYNINGNNTSGLFGDGIKDTPHSTSAVLSMNMDNIQVSANYVDNAGYTKAISRVYNIDKVIPVINVSYDLNEPANDLYYNATRTAVVEIRERNFNANDVTFTITNTDEVMPVIGNWTSSGTGDETVHRCTVTFAEDGDYTFTVSFMDKAGNRAEYNRVDTFTIDKTVPTYSVTYDNNDAMNGHYYDAERIATIEILEHNFDPSLVNITMTATNGEAGIPAVSGWSRNGDVNTATIAFSADADYTFDIAGMDLALNVMDDYAQDIFVIDTVQPEIVIYDIENLSANNGVVRPGIRYSDINYDAENTDIKMTGYHNGVVAIEGDKTELDNGVEIKLNDFAHEQSMDDIYIMDATVYDLAGNSSTASVMFSVNRFGSVYTFDDGATNALIGENGSYYTQAAPDIVITETNVDTLEFKEITCNLNGKLTTLKEGEHYTLEESGSETSWKQYTYTLSKDNFKEDGTYILTIYSEDKASNTSDNNSKGKKIEFVVDTKKPSVVVSGIENEEQYRENEKIVTIDVQDNVLLSKVEVYINGTVQTYTAAQIEEMDGKIEVKFGGANNWQTMQVTAYDAAGNELSSDEVEFLITTNILVQFFMNKTLFFGSIGAVAVIGVGIFASVFVKKRKKIKK